MIKNIAKMKIKIVLILIALTVSIASPLSINIAPSINGTYLFSLDVCQASSPAASVNVNMRYIYECPCRHIILEFVGFHEVLNPSFNSFLVAFQEEHPPRV